ncbi:SEC-C domain-containing protein [Carnimonas bestiolae]|uniref:SEC-C domain-containing protein n=1 Tax=Carnimonas bestiolae TaxID=3402172 RepID=UPI003EDC16DD
MADHDDIMLVAWIDQLLSFSAAALGAIRSDECYPSLLRWARRDGARLVGEDVRLAQALAAPLWNQTPLVRLDFASEPLAKPAANEMCWCDSGRRFRDCCQQITFPGPLPDNLMWMLSLCQWRGDLLKRAANSRHTPLQALLEAGIVDAEAGQLGRAQLLFELLFERSHQRNEHALVEQAFESLEQLYRQRGFSRKLDRLIGVALASDSDRLKGFALEQLTLAELENDDLAAARENFALAQRLIPDAPMLAYLETMLLLQEGHADKAQQRAAFWHRRLARRSDADPDELAFVQQLARHPAKALADEMIATEDELADSLLALRNTLWQLPDAVLSGLVSADDGTTCYIPSRKDREYYQAWSQVTGQQQGLASELEAAQLWMHARRWLPALNEHPQWLVSPLVMRELATALASRFGSLPWMADAFITPLARRFDIWLNAIERRHAALPWQQGDNSVIYLFGLALISALERSDRRQSRRFASRLYRLDSEDPMGLYELVLEHLLLEERNEKVVALINGRHGHESPIAEALAHALALFRLERRDRAAAVIKSVKRINRYVVAMMTPVRLGNTLTGEANGQPGSRAEAWQVRLLLRGCWVATPGALEWLTQFA